MAGALAPVVWLMVLASVLFGAAGILDGIYPGGTDWSFEAYGGLGWTSYAFGVVNLLVALFIARGSERSLTLRIGLAAVFVLERTTTAFFPVPKSLPSMGVHLATALIEAVILTATWRVWRLGHVEPTDLALLTLPGMDGAAVMGGGPTGATATSARPAILERPKPPRKPAGASRRRVLLRVLLVFVLVIALAAVAGAVLTGIVDLP